MKARTTSPLLACLVSLVALPAHAQSIQYILIQKEQFYTQRKSGPNFHWTQAPQNSFQFTATVEPAAGSNISGIATPSLLSVPAGNSGPIGPIGPMVYIEEDGNWQFQQSFDSLPALHNAYGIGAYGMNILGANLWITLPNESFFYPEIPGARTSSGSIIDGVLLWDPSQPLTLTLTPRGTLGTAAVDMMIMSVTGPGFAEEVIKFDNLGISIDIPAATFLPNQTYEVEMSYINIAGATQFGVLNGGLLDGAQYAGLYVQTAYWTIQTIPEPSTYAAFAGLGALGLAFWRRRKQAAQARLA